MSGSYRCTSCGPETMTADQLLEHRCQGGESRVVTVCSMHAESVCEYERKWREIRALFFGMHSAQGSDAAVIAALRRLCNMPDVTETSSASTLPFPDSQVAQPTSPERTQAAKLTKPQQEELGRLAQRRQNTYGRARTRVQNILVARGLARFCNGDSVHAACEITEAGRAAYEATRKERKNG